MRHIITHIRIGITTHTHTHTHTDITTLTTIPTALIGGEQRIWNRMAKEEI